MPLFAKEKGFDPGDLGVFFFFTHVPQFFAVLAAGVLADRFGRKMPIIPAAVLLAVGILLFIAADTYWMLMLSGVLLGIGEGLAGPPTVAYFVDRAPRGLEGVTMGLYGTVGGGGALIGALLLGSISDTWGFDIALWVDALLLLGLALGVIFIARETRGKLLKKTAPNG
jgi:MFS family permease